MTADSLEPRVGGTDDLAPAAGFDADVAWATIPNYMDTGHTYTAIIRMTNTGTRSWSTGNKVRLGARNYQARLFGPKRNALTTTVRPGESQTFTFTMTAPQSSGVYWLTYRMVKDGSRKVWFGESLVHSVSVSGTHVRKHACNGNFRPDEHGAKRTFPW